MQKVFARNNIFTSDNLVEFIAYLDQLESHKQVVIQESVLNKLSEAALEEELAHAASRDRRLDFSQFLKVDLYKYQQDGIDFGLYKKAVLIGD